MIELEGRAVAGLQRAFFENWCFACDETRAVEDRHFPELPAGERWLQVVRSGPDRDVYPIHELLFSAIAAADARVWVTCPYLVPDESILTAIRSAAHRGVDVRLLVSARSDSRLVDAAVRSFYDDWLAAGVRVFEYGPAMLHAKSVLVDRELAVIGSANLDNRSFRLNFEIVAAIYGAEMADALATSFERDLASATEVTREHLARRGRGRLFAENAARLFAIQL
jgi:cardiolipin synthase